LCPGRGKANAIGLVRIPDRITGCRRPSALANLADIAARIFVRDGVSRDNAIPLAGTVVAAERDGSLSHGLLRLPG